MDRLDLARMDAQQPAEAHVASEAHCLDQSGTVLDRRIDAVQRRRQACQARLQEQRVTGVTENLFGGVAAAVEIEVQGQVEAAEGQPLDPRGGGDLA
ncbi:Uncharacterised protein [Acinetobacter baumannii]|nr:Uncharacterised protein [Acinetobacter baumannii]